MNLSENNNIPLENDKNTIRFGLFILISVFGILGVWAAFAPLSSSSVASAVVSAGTNKKIVQHLEGGIVKEIFVKNDDFVKKGDLLVKLDDLQFKTEFEVMENSYFTHLAIEARLKAYENEDEHITFPKSIINQRIIKEQNDIFYSRMKLISNERIVTLESISQLKEQKSGLITYKNSKQKYLKSVKEELKELKDLLKDDLIDKVKYRELNRLKNKTISEIRKLSYDISEKDIQISSLNTQNLLKEKEFENIILEKKAENKKKLLDVIANLEIVKDRLKRTNIIAPKSGLVINFKYSTIGEVVNPRDTILEIVPKDVKLNLLAKVTITDIDKVKVGLESDIIFSAFNLKTLSIIKGIVTGVSADALFDEATGTTYYEAKVEITKEGLETLKQNDLVLVSGMPAQVMIKIGGRTTLQYFIKPFSVMLTRSFNEE